VFFFEKKNQKTFALILGVGNAEAAGASMPNNQKFFGSFFQKRTPSYPYCGNLSNNA
jgi:hypothetical protein